MPTKYSIEKWYLDCTTDVGDCAIGYYASLQLGNRKFYYSALLSSISCSIENSSIFLNTKQPDFDGNSRLNWNEPSFNLYGSWNSLQPAFTKKLFQNSDGEVRWDCYFPLAMANIRTDSAIFDGFGYAEKMSMTIPPWKLPIRELRWGRWTADKISVVWIQWQGEYPLTLILCNGIEYTDGHITDSIIETKDFSLDLQFHQTLRDGFVINTALRNFPGIKQILPSQARYLYESKWLSRGIFKSGDTFQNGWAIHEVVRW